MNPATATVLRSSVGRGLQVCKFSQRVKQNAPSPFLSFSSRSTVQFQNRAMSGSNGYSEPDKQGQDGGFDAYPREARKGPSQAGELLRSVLESYQRVLREHPVATKAVTSLVGFAIGDRIAQTIGGGTWLLCLLWWSLFSLDSRFVSIWEMMGVCGSLWTIMGVCGSL